MDQGHRSGYAPPDFLCQEKHTLACLSQSTVISVSLTQLNYADTWTAFIFNVRLQ